MGRQSNAASIGVNFGADVASLAQDETAGVIRQDHFNNIIGTPALVSGLVADPDGTASTTAVQQTNVSMTLSSFAFVESLNNHPTTSDGRLMDGVMGLRNAIVAPASSTPVGIGFSGLSSFTTGPYDVYVYTDSPAIYTNLPPSLRDSQLSLTSGTGSAILYFQDLANFPGNGTTSDYVLTGSTDRTQATPGNYIVFHGVTGDAFSVYGLGPFVPGGPYSAAVNAIQIVPVPEPELTGAVVLVALTQIIRRRRGAKL